MSYVRLVAVLAAVWFLGGHVEEVLGHLHHGFEGPVMPVFVALFMFFVLNSLSVYLSRGTVLPSFMTLAVLVTAGQDFFNPAFGDKKETILLGFAIFGAVKILLQGGLETPFANFQKLFWKILSLSFVGLFVTAVLYSYGLVGIGTLIGVPVTAVTALLLGAILASTDPAAIIPVTRDLKWRDLTAKDTVVAESAASDVTGALFTTILLGVATVGSVTNIWSQGYALVFTGSTILFILKQVVFGSIAGLVGFLVLWLFDRYQKGQSEHHAVDVGIVISAALGSYILALLCTGNGFLAAFVAGLVFHVREHMHPVEHKYADFIDVFGKGAVFFALGMLVNVSALMDYALVGILAALLFMFVIRPLAVLVAIGPFLLFQGKDKTKSVSWQDMAFMMWVRETGAIPAVLLVVTASQGIPGTEALVPIGMWAIILTLIVQPPLTPWFARKLGLAE